VAKAHPRNSPNVLIRNLAPAFECGKRKRSLRYGQFPPVTINAQFLA
jgi:hypothetical protein